MSHCIWRPEQNFFLSRTVEDIGWSAQNMRESAPTYTCPASMQRMRKTWLYAVRESWMVRENTGGKTRGNCPRDGLTLCALSIAAGWRCLMWRWPALLCGPCIRYTVTMWRSGASPSGIPGILPTRTALIPMAAAMCVLRTALWMWGTTALPWNQEQRRRRTDVPARTSQSQTAIWSMATEEW